MNIQKNIIVYINPSILNFRFIVTENKVIKMKKHSKIVPYDRDNTLEHIMKTEEIALLFQKKGIKVCTAISINPINNFQIEIIYPFIGKH